MKKKEFYAIFKVMGEYYGTKPSDALMEIYWQAFQNWSLEDFKTACNLVMQTRVYPSLPKIPEITEMIHGKLEDQAALAYQILVETMKRVGPWETVIFEDGAIGRTIEALGGWELINEWTIDEWKYRKKDFDQLYVANLRQGCKEPVKLFGTFDRINGTNSNQGWNQPILVTKDMRFLPRTEPKKIEGRGIDPKILSLTKKILER